MGAIEEYRRIIRELIAEYAQYKPSHGEIETEAVIDSTRDHYEVIHVGWDGARRVHGSVVHIDIIDGKIWIQYDGTSRPVADALIASGVPPEAIVLGFQPRHVRPHTGFSTGDVATG
jgi:hypothetical protein